MNMKKNKTLIQLYKIHLKIEKNGFLTESENELFQSLVITSYAKSPVAKIVLEIENESLEFSTQCLSNQLQLATLRNSKQHVPFWGVQPHKLKKLPETDQSQQLFRLMVTPYALLPKQLTVFQNRQLAQLETLLKYTAAYIIRNRYRKELCDLPKVDNCLKSFFDAWADCWYKLLNLCSIAIDFLNPNEREKLPKSWIWLDAIVQEHRQWTLINLVKNKKHPLISKEKQIEYWRVYATSLEKRRIPFDINPEERPNLYRLLEITTQMVGDSLYEYITSIKKFAKILENPKVIAVKSSSDGEFAVYERRGKSM